MLVEQRDDIAVVSLNDPANLNALTERMVEALDRAMSDAMKSARVIVLRGAGRSFCAGFNLGPAVDLDDPQFDAGAVLESHVNGLMVKFRDSPVPIVTAVVGAAAGAGASLALAGDLIVAGAKTYFLQAFVRVGLVPDGGASWLLARSLSRARAMELTLLGDRLDAASALSWGLINRVVADEAVDATALELAQRLAAGPRRALSSTRRAIWTAADSTFPEQLALERRLQREAGRSPDFREGVTAFREKRKPRFVD